MASVFSSQQIGTTPSNGYVLQTNGSNSTWVATSSLGISGGGGGGSFSTTSINNFATTTFTFATTTANGLNLTISTSSTAITFSPSLVSGYSIPLSASTTNWQSFFISPCSYLIAGTSITCTGTSTISSTASSTAPGGSSGQIQYNNGSVLGGMSKFTNDSGNPNIASGGALEYNGSTMANALTANHDWFFGQSGSMLSSGSFETSLGYLALTSDTTGNDNIAIGHNAGSALSTGSNNVAIGTNALGGFDSVGSGSIGIGYGAGYYETGSSTLYIDNQIRGSLATEKTGALLYGTFNSTPANQTLALNAAVTIPYTLGVSGTSTLATTSISSLSLSGLTSSFLAVNGSGVVIATTTPAGGSGLTSVGISLPTGLSVSNSPLTSNGTLAVSMTSSAFSLVKIPTYVVAASGGDYTTIQGALDAASSSASGANIQVKAGVYTLSSPLLFKGNHVHVTGEGWSNAGTGGTIIQFNGATIATSTEAACRATDDSCINTVNDDFSLSNVEIDDTSQSGSTFSGKGTCVDTSYTDDFLLDRVFCYGAKNGFWAWHSLYNKFNNNEVDPFDWGNGKAYAYYLGGDGSADGANSAAFTGINRATNQSDTNSTTTIGFYLDGQMSNADDLDAEGLFYTGVEYGPDSYSNKSHVYVETGNTAANGGVLIDSGATAVSVSGESIANGSADAKDFIDNGGVGTLNNVMYGASYTPHFGYSGSMMIGGTTTPGTALDVNGDITDRNGKAYVNTGASTGIVCYTTGGKLGHITITSLLASGNCVAN